MSRSPIHRQKNFEAIVMGVSSGGLTALGTVLPCFDKTIGVPIIIVQHLRPDVDTFLPKYFDSLCSVKVKEGEDKEVLMPATVYFAPPGYHLLVEPDRTLSLSTEARVNYSRPSIDVLFETAAEVFLDKLIGVVLTGANSDGAKGLEKIKRLGGLTIVQNPETAESDVMPRSAIALVTPDRVIGLDALGPLLNRLSR